MVSSIFLGEVLLGAIPLGGQEVVTLRDRRCTGCSVQITPMFDLDSGVDGYLEGEPNSIARDRNGRYLLAQFSSRTEFSVFSPRGALEGIVGRLGSGPGEYRSIGHVAVVGDSVLVFDEGMRRVSVLDINFEPVRTFSFPGATTSDALVDGRAVVTVSDIPTPDLAGLPLHEIHLDRESFRSFGANNAIYRPQTPWLNSRAITGSIRDGIWSAKHMAYELELWVDGELRRTLRRDVSWFPPYVDKKFNTPDPPPPWIIALKQLDARYLCVFILMAADEYTKKLGPKVKMAGGEYYDIDRRRLLRDTRFEIIDTEDGLVIYTGLLDEFVAGLIGGTNVFFAYDEVEGVPSIRLFEFSFIHP